MANYFYKCLLIFVLINLNIFSNVVMDDKSDILNINKINKFHTDDKYEVRVLVSNSIDGESDLLYGAEYFEDNDIGKNGVGILIFIILDTRTVRVITGNSFDYYGISDVTIHKNITIKIIEGIKEKGLEHGLNIGISNSIKIIQEMI